MIDLRMGDCLERMKEIPDGSVDLTVTSPPYDNLRTYNGTLNDWTPEKWQAIIRELFRVTKQGGVAVWVVGDATIKGSETGTSFRQALYAMECGFRLHDTMIYQKPHCAFPDSTRYYQQFEYMFVLSKGAPFSFNPICDRENKSAGRVVSGTSRNKDGSTSPKGGNGNKIKPIGVRFNVWLAFDGARHSLHPAPFPESLARDHILSWSNEGDVVLDPFMGSGTTGVSAKRLNRKFIGIERDESYFNIAKKRIESEVCWLLD